MLNFDSGKIVCNMHKGRKATLLATQSSDLQGKKTLIIPGNNVRVKVDLAFCIMKGEC